MISENQKQDYKLYNKIYIPQQYYNENFKYTINNDTLTIITNQNCTTNYNTTQCTCYQYNINHNIITNESTCNRNPNYTISQDYITTDINYSDRITNYYTNNYIVMYGIIIIAILTTILFKKNSRNI